MLHFRALPLRCLFALALLTFNSSAQAQAPQSNPKVIDTARDITYIGISTVPGVEKFLNIPYGKDTSGERRFKTPEPAELPEGTVYDATEQGLMCPQSGGWMSEDCLNLMVARPTYGGEGWREGKTLPVMVWIYGGGLFDGNINDPRYQPDSLILQSVENRLPVIFVSMNYRLNIFGFASSSTLRETNDLNVGLKDQRLALEWVKENIHFFGGDPDRVTILGQSSGGLSVALQILAYGGSKGAPFRSAIMQSSSLQPASTSSITQDSFNAIAELTGCGFHDPQNSAESLSCLRNLPMATLLEAAETHHNSMFDRTDGDVFLPTIDDDFLPMAPSELARRGMFVKMPVLIGWTQDDATKFTPGDKDSREFLRLFFPDLSEVTVEKILDLYPERDFDANVESNLGVQFYRSAQIMRDILFVCPSFLFGWSIAKKYWDKNNLIYPPVYFFDFNQTTEDDPGFGVVHSSDLPYVFGNLNRDGDREGEEGHLKQGDYEVEKRTSRSWSTFVNIGAPSLPSETDRETLLEWEEGYGNRYSVTGNEEEAMSDAKVYVIGGPRPGINRLEEQKLKERCGFLNREDVVKELKY
ncbi:alpha/beta-hydrolase [Dendrothele bispora CBS 962.96]|uniref:Carboxylic ester hydrolase n=1 Tax=Dendrothele bispora (strain CBS 962.96) TaxID=1314807 RepID=A0A4S8MEL1_DENBC|nr:alpha/beta-hydrolase [Dendrothele bispora CBS 962.96]